MTIINHMMKKIDTDVSNLKQGLQPQNLSFWYSKIIQETIDMAPPWLQDKIKVHQDPILKMKFNLDDLYQIESGASYKKIYRFKNKNIGKVVVNFSYNHNDYLSFLEVNNFLSNIA